MTSQHLIAASCEVAVTGSGCAPKGAAMRLVYVGVVGIVDPPRAETATAIADARRAGITGDDDRR